MSEYSGGRGKLKKEDSSETEGRVLMPGEVDLDENSILVDLRRDSEYLSRVISNYEAKLEQGIGTENRHSQKRRRSIGLRPRNRFLDN